MKGRTYKRRKTHIKWKERRYKGREEHAKEGRTIQGRNGENSCDTGGMEGRRDEQRETQTERAIWVEGRPAKCTGGRTEEGTGETIMSVPPIPPQSIISLLLNLESWLIILCVPLAETIFLWNSSVFPLLCFGNA